MVIFRYMTALTVLVCVAGTSIGQDKYWYKSFSGTIDKYPVTLHLHKADHEISGYYYYNKIQQPFSVNGDDTTIAGKIRLLSSSSDPNSDIESFTLTFQGDSLTGEWKKSYNSASAGLPVKAKAVNTLAPAFDLVFTSGSEILRPKLTESPTASYQISTVWPKGNLPATVTLKKMISESLGLKNVQTDIGPALLADKKKFFADYFSDHKNEPDSELLRFPSGYTQDVSGSVSVVYHSPTILSLANFLMSYSGGAHGNYSTTYICINPTTGKPYTLSMVLSASGRKQLNTLLEKKFRRDLNLSAKDPLTEAGLFDDKFEANNNFYLTGTGISFTYNPYEIGPYAMGQIEVFIPYSDFGPAGLNPSFKK
ncbi:MAG: hypothetical protein DI535_07815 [Citrobacter freundii]|nr:MAG: hypothetical protein DI535_07815 [Citrobacter freundii]